MAHQPGDRKARSPIGLSVLATIGTLAVILAMIYVGNRLETIEDRLSFRPPESAPAATAAVPVTSTGRSVYVPAYSHIYSRGGQAFLLEVTLSVRNTDPELPIRIDGVRYHDTQGRLIRELGEAELILAPLQTASYLVEKRDVEGGSGASFVVDWSAEEAANPPIIESVMIGLDAGHNISFTSRGQPIARSAD